jgi:Protein of unknown function (DUF3467)
MSTNNNAPVVELEQNDTSLQPKVVKVSDYKAMYANFIQTGYTAFDISVNVGETAGSQEGRLLIEMKGRISMAPLEAKMLLAMLNSTIENYERQFGAITVPPGVFPDLPEVAEKKDKEDCSG